MAISTNPWQSVWRKLPAPLQNRYNLALAIFFFILIFLDKHSILTQFKLFRAQQRLESDKSFYQQKIKEARDEAEDFDVTKEKFAREHYFMKQQNEDVYIIQENK
jgi:hypothetical protein